MENSQEKKFDPVINKMKDQIQKNTEAYTDGYRAFDDQILPKDHGLDDVILINSWLDGWSDALTDRATNWI